jgi:hypothetical protein
MSNDRQVISYLSPADLVGLMKQSGVIAIHESGMSDGKPVIHASVKVVNAQTGEQLPGGLPFSVVMFKGPNEPGYSNIAIGTIVPVLELKVALPRDYFNFCNQRFRFTRTFPVDEHSFVIQMDLVVKNATREYVKFSFGLWGALFSQMLFELMGRGRESVVAVAEAYAAVHTDFAEQIATTPALSESVAPTAEESVEADAVMPLTAEAIVAGTEVEAPQAEAAVTEAKVEEIAVPPEPVEIAAPEFSPELSIVAGPAAVELVEVETDAAADLAVGEAEATDVRPG